MKIIAWNVNGLRSLLKTDYLDELILNEKPDILCFGETKLSCHIEVKLKYPEYKYIYWSLCNKKKGYSGTAIFCKKKPLKLIPTLNIDDEGRIITLELKNFYLIHVYTPNSGEKLLRLDWRTEIWDRAFEKYIIELQKNKPVIVCGDLNVAHKEIDLKNPKTNLKTAGYTLEERESFNKILENCNLIDSFRKLNPNEILYSYWSYRRNSRNKNIGWRIDYFLIDKKLENKIKISNILINILGSDHAPIKLII